MNDPRYPSMYNAQPIEMQEDIQRAFIMRVYGWMALGLTITAGAALVTLTLPGLLQALVNSRFLFLGLILAQLLLVVALTAAINRITPFVAGSMFAVYAALNGVTLSILMLIYTESSIAITFGITAATFGIMSLYGWTTKRDLTRLGSLLMMALIGLILASLANMFFRNSAVYWLTTYAGVLIFVGLVAYDTQKLKNMSLALGEDGEVVQKASVVGALRLYLDFINLFLFLLRILGRRR